MVSGEVINSLTSNILFNIGIIIIVGTVIAYFVKFLKQPLMPAYIIAGVLLGPYGFNLVKDVNDIKLLAELGIAFLLFMVGLEMDIKKLKDVGFTSISTGLIEVALLFIVGFLVAGLLGFVGVEAVYLGFVLAFSSTLIVVKLLSDRNELGTLHGRLILGILLVQDIIAVLVLSFLSTQSFSLILIGGALFKIIGLFIFAVLISKYLLPSLFKFSAKSQELLFLSSLAFLFFLAFISYTIGFSIIIGAFIAGLALGQLPYNYEIAGQVRSLRDFFITLFFVILGVELFISDFSLILLPLIIFFFVTLLFKPFIISFFVSLFGYKKRTSVLSGISLAQISEFSLILVSQGFLLGHISNNVFSLTVLVTILSMVITPYIINNENYIYNKLSKPFRFLDKMPTHREELEYEVKKTKKNIVLIGCHRMGSILLKHLGNFQKNLLVVDYDPDIIKSLIKQKVTCLYGDLFNEEVLNKINFKYAKIVISTVPNVEDSLFLINYIKRINSKVIIFVTANYKKDAMTLYNAGADYVILPQFLSGEIMLSILKKSVSKNWIKSLRKKHINYLVDAKIFGK